MSSLSSKDTREGGREEPKAPSPELSGNVARPRNSSGNASLASSVLDLRVKLNTAYDLIEALCERLGDADLLREVKQYRQRGTRPDRRER